MLAVPPSLQSHLIVTSFYNDTIAPSSIMIEEAPKRNSSSNYALTRTNR